MARLRCEFFSDVLGMETSMTVLLPQRAAGRIGVSGRDRDGDLPTLYLLHGLSDDDTAWTRYTSIERYASDLGIAVVMPQVHRSFYTDEVYGRPYWTFVSEELPAVARNMFRLSDRPEDTFAAGLSMGGYGAFKLALRHPDRFGAAASLSGVLDLADRVRTLVRPEDPRMWQRIFGDTPIDGTPDDLVHLLGTVEQPPPLFLWCGTEDVLHDGNVRFQDACARHGVALTASFSAGTHEWSHWDRKIQEVLAWLPLA